MKIPKGLQIDDTFTNEEGRLCRVADITEDDMYQIVDDETDKWLGEFPPIPPSGEGQNPESSSGEGSGAGEGESSSTASGKGESGEGESVSGEGGGGEGEDGDGDGDGEDDDIIKKILQTGVKVGELNTHWKREQAVATGWNGRLVRNVTQTKGE